MTTDAGSVDTLRAEIWKLALMLEDETALLQTLLDKLGNTLPCDCIAFILCQANGGGADINFQWRANELGLPLGFRFPCALFSPYAGQTLIDINLNDLEAFSPDIANFLEDVRRRYHIRAMLLVPYGELNAPKGYIALCNIHQPRAYSTAQIDLLIEFAKIIHLRLQQLQSQAALQASETRYRQMFETNMAIKLIIDPASGQIVEANQAAVQFYGYDYATLTQLHITDINTLPETEIRAKMARAKKTESLFFNFQHRLASGDIRDVEVYSGPVHTPQGDLLYSIVHDVTQHHQAEEALQFTTRMLNASQRIAKMGSYQTDLTTGTWVGSESFINIFGLPQKDEYTLEEFQALVHPDDFDEVMAYFGDCLAQQRDFNCEYRCQRPDGETIYVNSQSKIYYADDGTPLRIIGVKQDITERKQLERKLVKQERLAAVGQLAAGIAHDFNNILTSILGFTELIQMSPETPASLQDKLGKIRASSEQAAHLVRQIMDFGQKTVRHPQKIALAEFVLSHQQLFTYALPENIHLNLYQIQHLSKSPEAYLIEADTTQLQQMIMNLILNARDAMPQGGQIDLRLTQDAPETPLACATCSQTIEGPWIQLQLQDNGEGIARQILPRIFEPFFTTREVGQGSGLGLSQVAGIVAQSQGHIHLESQPGQGTCVTVFFPPLSAAVPQPDDKQPAPGSALSKGGGETILLVEDDAVVLETATAMLEQLGYQVLSAENGRQAMNEYRAHQAEVDLVLSDVAMPDMGGKDLFRHLRAESPGLKLILMSGYPAGQEDIAFLQTDKVAWLEKPISLSQLSATLSHLLAAPKGRWD